MEEGLVAKRKQRSCKGEIGNAPKNLAKRDFRVHVPDQSWLADITEFPIPAGKAHLSPIVDYFDGICVAWSQSTSPDAELVNPMSDAAASKLHEDDYPVGHGNRAAIAVGPAGSGNARDTASSALCRRRAALPTTLRWEGSSDGSKSSSSTGVIGRDGRSIGSWMRSMITSIGTTRRESSYH